MMSPKYDCLFLLNLLALLCSCEEVIELELDSAEQRIVIEANLNATVRNCIVRISKSGDFYASNQFENVAGATILVTNSTGNQYTLREAGDGLYAAGGLLISSGEIATLQVKINPTDNRSFTATDLVPQRVELDSLFVEPIEGDGPGPEFRLVAQWQDIPDVSNFYRLKVYRNGIFQSDVYTLTNDALRDGEMIERPVIGKTYRQGDELRVELLSVNRGYYDYFVDIANSGGRGISSPTPVNPVSNINNEALGFFGLWHISERTIIAR